MMDTEQIQPIQLKLPFICDAETAIHMQIMYQVSPLLFKQNCNLITGDAVEKTIALKAMQVSDTLDTINSPSFYITVCLNSCYLYNSSANLPMMLKSMLSMLMILRMTMLSTLKTRNSQVLLSHFSC